MEDGIRAVKRFKPEYDKVMRLHAQTATIENGFIYLPQEGHWLAEYVHELTTFPNGKYDDQVDSTSQALEWVKQRRPGQGFLDYMRRGRSEPDRAAGVSGLYPGKDLTMSDERKVRTVEAKVDKDGKTEAPVGTGKTTGKATADSMEEAAAEAEERSKKD